MDGSTPHDMPEAGHPTPEVVSPASVISPQTLLLGSLSFAALLLASVYRLSFLLNCV